MPNYEKELRELPALSSSAYSSQLHALGFVQTGVDGCVRGDRRVQGGRADTHVLAVAAAQLQKEVPSMRIVRVFIADTNDSIPLEKRVLFSGDEKATDLTNEELFYEIDVKNLLDTHNTYRCSLRNKSIKDRVENLEPVRIRDLRMTVVEIASFK